MTGNRIAKGVIISFYLFAVVYLLTRTWQYCEVYPFSRVLIRSTLTHSVRLFNDDGLFDTRISLINGQPLKNKTAAQHFTRPNDVNSVTLVSNDTMRLIRTDPDSFNTDFFVF
ncbi:MAG: hypothetical protein ACOCWH_02610 [Spirochaetota bacterium]